MSTPTSDSIKKEKSNSNDPKYIKKKRELKDFETYQQSFLLSLLNIYCGFTIRRQRKQSVVTTEAPTVEVLHFVEGDVHVAKLADAKCRPLFEQEVASGVTENTAFRRLKKNKKCYVTNLLIDLCRERGYAFDSKLSRQSKKSDRLERIEKVSYNGELLFTCEEVVKKGSKVNDLLNQKLRHSHGVIIERLNKDITDIFTIRQSDEYNKK
ncbi:hypothetical protein QTN25_004160 [Entamoeba marina]